jgi:polysaccharide pyruvyl transferase WcaK-like protein
MAVGPFDWAALPALADLLITDRFHGAVFALKNNVPVIALDHRNQISGSESKIRDLFGRVGILDYWFPVNDGMVTDHGDLNDRIKNIQTSWPREAVKHTCLKFSKCLEQFIDGPITDLISRNGHKARA